MGATTTCSTRVNRRCFRRTRERGNGRGQSYSTESKPHCRFARASPGSTMQHGETEANPAVRDPLTFVVPDYRILDRAVRDCWASKHDKGFMGATPLNSGPIAKL